ncbi:MAG: hypothetical protein L7S56_02035 [Candidatus Poseidonia sp.]|nr:hypothetical protein [Poseidonia sp.]
MKYLSRGISLLLVVMLIASVPQIDGKKAGIHNQAGSGCTCHYSTGTAITATHDFPSTYTAGTVYNINIGHNGGTQAFVGGFNVVVDKGTIQNAGTGVNIQTGTSATHTSSGQLGWTFDWVAPSTGSGTVSVDIAVLQGNGNNANSGDAWDSTSTTISEFVTQNTAPVASDVKITDDLQVTISERYYDQGVFGFYTFSDADSDSESNTQIRWYKDGTVAAQYNDQLALPNNFGSIGEVWSMSVTPSDGTDFGAMVTSSNSVTIIDYDADGDGYGDQSDAFPNDSSEHADNDSDGVGDNADAFDNDATQTTDTDGDGYGDNASGNNPDAFFNDENEWNDTDDDGVGDNADVFPNDPTEWAESDGDGVGDNADAFPNDANETLDTDGDGMGDNEQKVLEAKIANDDAAAQQRTMIGGAVILILIVIASLVFLRGRSGSEEEMGGKVFETQLMTTEPSVSMPNMAATPVAAAPAPMMVNEPTVSNEWTDENGHTWRLMSDGTNRWWNGTDWQKV